MDPEIAVGYLGTSLPFLVNAANTISCLVSLLFLLTILLRRVCPCCPSMKHQIMNVEAIEVIHWRDRWENMNIIEILIDIFSKPLVPVDHSRNSAAYNSVSELQPLNAQILEKD